MAMCVCMRVFVCALESSSRRARLLHHHLAVLLVFRLVSSERDTFIHGHACTCTHTTSTNTLTQAHAREFSSAHVCVCMYLWHVICPITWSLYLSPYLCELPTFVVILDHYSWRKKKCGKNDFDTSSSKSYGNAACWDLRWRRRYRCVCVIAMGQMPTME